jgi:gentisate 1,2-dioxygenase
MYMVPGDLIITPSWNWHDHGNESNTNVIWLDGLNIPLFKHLPVDFTEVHEEEFGVLTHESKPVSDEECAEMKFPWKIMQARLDELEGDHAVQEYTLPDGKSVSTTIGAYAHRISAGKASKFSQDTAGYIFQVHGGSGWAEVHSLNGDKTYKLTWGRGDAFVIPSWHRLKIFADEGETVYLFSFSDRPMLENLGFWRAKERAE